MTSWMREGQSEGVNAEDYLLGKAVGKEFEQAGTLGQINAVEYDCTPESIFSSRADHQVDLQRKLQEDPLIALKKQEIDSRRKILDNPVKMKEIKAHLEKMRKKKSKKEKKRKKKSKKSRESHSEDSANEADLDALLLQKLGGGSEKASTDSRRSRSSSSSRSKSPPGSPPRPRGGRRNRADSRDRLSRGVGARRSPDRVRRTSPRRRRSRSPVKKSSPSRRSSASPRTSYSERRKREEEKSEREKDDWKRDSRRRDRGAPVDRRPPKRSGITTSRLTEEDEEKKMTQRLKKLAEMQENAKWAEKKQRERYEKHKKEEEHEEKETLKKHDPDFIRRELVRATDSESVEKRIQANKHNIQRGALHMDKNFARK